MVHLDDIEIGPLLHLPVWADAHECLDDEEDGKKSELQYFAVGRACVLFGVTDWVVFALLLFREETV